jgi:hypothetical protein
MSKKIRERPSAHVPAQPAAQENRVEDRGQEVKDEASFELIRFDKKAILYIAACLLLYVVFVGLKWHNSSIPIWNEMADDGGDKDRGLIKGTPLSIRSDEWLVTTSFMVAQMESGYPVANENTGYGKSPLLMGLPTNHILSKARPAFWGFYLLDKERAFSWYWNFKVFPFLIASFLLLMLLTRNNFLLSAFGSVWLLFSSAIQWWSINTDLFTYGFLCVIACIYIVYSTRLLSIAVNGVVLLFASYSFAMVLYPAYQVPLAYFLISLLIGFALQNRRHLSVVKKKLIVKAVVLICSLAGFAALMYLFYHEAKDTIEVVTNTIYPGKRNEKGGDFIFSKMFVDNFSWFVNAINFPARWNNICELSSYLMLSPIVAILIVYNYITTKKANALLISVLVFQVVICLWMLVGFPETLAKATAFNTSPSYRSFYVFGFANVVFTLLFLSYYKVPAVKPGLVQKLVVSLVVFVIAYFLNKALNRQSEQFFTDSQVLNASLVFALLNCAVIFFPDGKLYQYGLAIGCLIFISPNVKINPLSEGLAPYYENAVFNQVAAIHEKDPKGGWVVFGKFTYANFFKAAGINWFGGVQFAPPLQKLRVLDPERRYDSVYNRYAHIAFSSMAGPNDTLGFVLNQQDYYLIWMDPCSPKFKQLGIRYIVFSNPPEPFEIRCLTHVLSTTGIHVYKND